MRLTASEFTRISKALADPHRSEILEKAAAVGELSCSHLCTQFSVSQATISHHLKELATAGLLERRKDGQFAYFKFRSDVMAAYVEELERRMGIHRG